LCISSGNIEEVFANVKRHGVKLGENAILGQRSTDRIKQMKKWIWLMLLVLTTVAVVSCSGFVPQRSPLVVETIRVAKPQAPAESKQLVSTSQVSATKLFAHIQNLSST